MRNARRESVLKYYVRVVRCTDTTGSSITVRITRYRRTSAGTLVSEIIEPSQVQNLRYAKIADPEPMIYRRELSLDCVSPSFFQF
jgi:hypothetical protein